MAAIMITSISINRQKSAHLDLCDTIGAYMIIVKCDRPEGGHAIFHCSCNFDGESRIRRTAWSSGSQGETLNLEWSEGCHPTIWYDDPPIAPLEDLTYTVKIL